MVLDFRLWVALLLAAGVPSDNPGGSAGWVSLSGEPGLSVWRQPLGDWYTAGEVEVHPDNAKRLRAKPDCPGSEVLINGPTGKTANLVTKDSFGDIELSLEFFIPKGSNSGVKLMGLYEIQIYDSWGVEKPRGTDSGGIYPRAEIEPRYHHIDEGVPPRTNAARAPGEWQSLEIVFRAPRFDEGKKVQNARFEKVVLNGEVVHQDVEVKWGTGHAWHKPEVPSGPLLLQADHGPVAFRNIRIRKLD